MTLFTASNIMQSYRLARKSRKAKQEVYMFDQNLEYRLLKMINDLKNRKYIHGKYKEIILFDSKKRYIYSPIFRDHILHHLVYKEIYKQIDKKMVYSTFACRKGFGTQKCILYLKDMIVKEKRRLLKSSFSEKNIKNGNKLYYLKLDFSKYFFSINHKKLKEKIAKVIKNEELLYCIDLIINSYKTPNIYNELLKKYDFYIRDFNKGLPIGGLISQLFANFYLNDFDQFLKHKLKLKFVRYMDDVIIFGSKDLLLKAKEKIFDFVKNERLILNPKKISFNLVDDGVKFIGYKIKKDRIYVGKRIKKSLLKFINSLKDFKEIDRVFTKKDIFRIQSMFFSRIGFFKISDNGENYIKNIRNIFLFLEKK